MTKTLVWDRESAIGGKGGVTQPAAAFAGTLATRIVLAPPRDPEFKGMVERNNGFFETSFLPGRQFTSPADFNMQLSDWLPRANSRTVRSLGGRPVDVLDRDLVAMTGLPPHPPSTGCRHRIRLGRDYYVRVDSERLLRRSAGDRPARRRHCDADAGDRGLRGAGRRRPRPLLGEPRCRHRPGPCRDRERTASEVLHGETRPGTPGDTGARRGSG